MTRSPILTFAPLVAALALAAAACGDVAAAPSDPLTGGIKGLPADGGAEADAACVPDVAPCGVGEHLAQPGEPGARPGLVLCGVPTFCAPNCDVPPVCPPDERPGTSGEPGAHTVASCGVAVVCVPTACDSDRAATCDPGEARVEEGTSGARRVEYCGQVIWCAPGPEVPPNP